MTPLGGQLASADEQLWSLAQNMCDGTITVEDRDLLEASLRASDSAKLFYAAYVDMHGRMLWRFRGGKGDTSTASTRQEGPVSSTDPRTSSFPTFSLLTRALPSTVGFFSSGWPVAYLIATVIFGIGLLIGSHVYVSGPEQLARQSAPNRTSNPQSLIPNPSPKALPVGRITGMVDCKWERKGLGIRDWGLGKESGAENLQPLIPNPQSPFSVGDKFTLASGLMEITYDSGAKVILQGPVTYEVESASGGYLSVGKLTGKVEKKVASGQWPVASKPETSNLQSLIPNPSLSTIHYPLFTIKTPTATVTDLGTEFGVEVDKRGVTTSYVFRGLVRVQVLTADGKPRGAGQVLRENESAQVGEGQGERRIVVLPAAKTTEFIRAISKLKIKTLDLVDVVAGGDGFSGRRNRGIDPTNGRTTDTLGKPERDSRDYLVGDGHYHRVEALPFVDGVFIPDGRSGKVRVDSAGHVFEGCPNSANTTSGYIWAGGVIPGIPTQMGGVEYSLPGHGVLFLHANKGITFDLAAIRRANPDHKLLRFRAVAGDTDMSGGLALADLWVLVDGDIRFSRWQINSTCGAFSVAVPIGENDRFLTLAATDGGNGIGIDWTMFGDPRLELTPVKVLEDAGLPPK